MPTQASVFPCRLRDLSPARPTGSPSPHRRLPSRRCLPGRSSESRVPAGATSATTGSRTAYADVSGAIQTLLLQTDDKLGIGIVEHRGRLTQIAAERATAYRVAARSPALAARTPCLCRASPCLEPDTRFRAGHAMCCHAGWIGSSYADRPLSVGVGRPLASAHAAPERVRNRLQLTGIVLLEPHVATRTRAAHRRDSMRTRRPARHR